MLGVYIHIPYCRHKCNYCNFYSIVSRNTAPQMIDAIIREMHLRKEEYFTPADIGAHSVNDKALLDTLYIGGGTPSLLEKPLIIKLFENVHSLFQLNDDSEITIETNPDDITQENLQLWKDLGINRLSIGIQSFRDEDLHYLHRIHNAQKAEDCIAQARDAGFKDVTIDLIYGIPTLSDENWISNLEMFKALNIPHLSAYSLTVEPKTALHHLIKKGKLQPVDELHSSQQFKLLMQFMESNNYLHYEISNFCLPGHFAKHNLSYWKSINYLGFGPSAHSYNGSKRQWNVLSVSEYINILEQNKIPCESENLSVNDKYNEYVMTRLRTMWGCNVNEIGSLFGDVYRNYFIENAAPFLKYDYLIANDDQYILTTNGKLLADRIASDLFYIEEL